MPPKPGGGPNHWSNKNRRGAGGAGGNQQSPLPGGSTQAGEKGKDGGHAANHKKPLPSVRSRSELRRILHDKLEWNERSSSLDLTLLVCADELDPAEAELIVVASGCVASTTRYVRSDIVEARRRREQMPVTIISPSQLPGMEDEEDEEEAGSRARNCQDCTATAAVPPGDELFRYDPSSKTHKCKVLNQIARSVQKAWCGLLFVPAYQIAQATAFIRALNPKPDSAHCVDGYISRLCCLEDLLWALRSARGMLNIEPPLAYSIWHSMREEDMAQLSEYTELTCTCVIATLHERPQSPPSLLAGSELWPSVVVPVRNGPMMTRVPWPTPAEEEEEEGEKPLEEPLNGDL